MNYTPFEAVVIEEQDESVLVQFAEFDDQELWVPRDKIFQGDAVLTGFEGELLISRAWAQKRGLL